MEPEGYQLVPPLSKLKELTDDEVRQRYDAFSGGGSGVGGAGFWLDELSRRRADRQTTMMVRLTWAIAGMTALNVVLVAYTIFL